MNATSLTDSYNANSPSNSASEISDKPTAAAPRFKDASAALSAYRRAKTLDDSSSKNRALVQAMVDGEPPFKLSALRAAGRPTATNINFLEGAAVVDATTTAYNALIDGVDTLARGVMSPGMFEPQEEVEFAEGIAEEISNLIRENPEFSFNWEYISRQVATHGVAVAYFPEDEGVDWAAGGLDDFVIPRQTRATEEAVDVLFALRKPLLHEIWRAIEDEKVATELGWNVRVAKKALVQASKGATVTSWATDWAELQTRLKNNDLGESFDSATVPVVHAWVREKSGKVSHYMFLADGSGNEEFLFAKRDRFDSPLDAFVIFTAGIGSNGTYHSIRGAAYRAYNVICESNKLRCAMIDGTKLAMATLIRPKDGESMDDMTIVVNGSTAYLPPDAEIADRGNFPSPAQYALPIVTDLSQLLSSTTGMFRPRPSANEGPDKTRFEMQAQIESQTALTTSAVNVFYRSMGRFLNSILRRVQKLDPEQLAITGEHPAILEFYRRVVARDIPVEAVKAMHKLVPIKALGLGSPTQRLAAVQGLGQLAGSFDAVGRRTFDRMLAATYLGYDGVDAVLPRNPAPRTTIDNKVAELEHSALEDREVQVDPTELHQTHIEVHFSILQPDFEEIKKEIDSGEEDAEDAIDDIQYLQRTVQHIAAHIEQLRPDPTRAEQVAQYDDAIGQYVAAVKRLADQTQAAIDEEENSQKGDKMSPEAQMKFEEHRQKMAMVQEAFDQKMRLKEAEAQQRARLRLLQTDVRLSSQIKQSNLRTYGPAAVPRR